MCSEHSSPLQLQEIGLDKIAFTLFLYVEIHVFTDYGIFYDVAHFVYVQRGETYVNSSRKGQFNNIC